MTNNPGESQEPFNDHLCAHCEEPCDCDYRRSKCDRCTLCRIEEDEGDTCDQGQIAEDGGP
jgi:hypothetical protein